MLSRTKDARAANAARRGSPATEDYSLVERLYVTEASAIARAQRRQHGRDEAADIVHDAFVRLLGLGPDRLTSLAGERPVAYLWRVARHLVIDRAKGDLRRSATLHISPDENDLRGGDVERQLVARDELRRVERAVRAMRPRTRAIFIAHRVDGMTYQEIAHECGIGIKAVEKQMSRAIAILAREMDDGD